MQADSETTAVIESGADRPFRVCYFGTYRAEYSRNQIIIAGLREIGVTVDECHSTLWHGIEDRVKVAQGGWCNPRFWGRVITSYWRLLRKYRSVSDYDVMLVGYPGHFDIYLAWLLTKVRKRPLVLDILMSLYLVAEERGLVARAPMTARLIRLLEGTGLRLPDLLIAENGEYEKYIRELHSLPADRFRHVPHGADNRVFRVADVDLDSMPVQVTYHGMFLPSHGLGSVIRAAEILKDDNDIEFHFYGTGPEHEKIVRYSNENQLDNVHFHGFVSHEELLEAIESSHICLGVFGTTRQACFTVQNKLWEALAMGKTVISGDSPTVRASFTHGDEIYLVERADPRSLASGLRELAHDPNLRERIARGGNRRFLNGNTVAHIGRAVKNVLDEAVALRKRRPINA